MANFEEKLKVLFGNEEFIKKFAEITAPEALKPLAKEFGVDLNDEELAEVINAASKQNDDELNEAALDNVTGGIFTTLGGILAGAWGFAVKTYGSPEKAVQGIGTYWAKKLGLK